MIKQKTFWSETLSPRAQRLLRPLPQTAEVAIIGAGLTGLSAAHTLAKSGVDVSVLEAETVGWGASSRNGGMVLTGLKLPVGELVWHWTEAEAEYKTALEMDPNHAYAHVGFASWLLCHGRTEEALEWARRGRELDPVAVGSTDIATMLTAARHYDEAIHELRVALAAQPDDPEALWDLGIALIDKNQPADAIPVLEKALSGSTRSPGVMGMLASAYARAGRRDDALRLIAELKKRRNAGYVPAKAFVEAYLGLGENDQAFDWLEQAYKEHSDILEFIKVDPELDPLRGDPRFAELVRRVGLS